MNPNFKRIARLFQKLPGVGPRQAARFVLALMEKPDSDLQDLGRAIQNLKKEISFCPDCFNISDNHLCAVCANGKRDRNKILVVEKVTDLNSIEKTGLYNGLYHVLGGAINPLDGATPDTLRIRELASRVAAAGDGRIELIIATNPNTPGETTSLYLKEFFQSADWRTKNIVLTRLARGLASGSNLEYADEITLKHALEYRK